MLLRKYIPMEMFIYKNVDILTGSLMQLWNTVDSRYLEIEGAL